MINDGFVELEKTIRIIMHKAPLVWKQHIKLGLTRSEVLVLYRLHAEGQQRASQVAQSLSITTGGLTGITDKLVRGGYITRKRDDKDRRVVYLTITKKGNEALKSMYASRKEFIDKLFHGVSKEEITQLREVTNKILTNLEDAITK